MAESETMLVVDEAPKGLETRSEAVGGILEPFGPGGIGAGKGRRRFSRQELLARICSGKDYEIFLEQTCGTL